MEFKNSLIKNITVVLCVLALCITSVSGVGKISKARVEAAKTAGSAVETGEPASDDDTKGGFEDNNDAETPTDADSSVTEDAGAAQTGDDNPSDDKTSASSNNSSSSPSSSSSASSSEPKTTAEIIKYYNNATAKAVNAKAGYDKTRMTDHENMEGSVGLKAMKSLVYKFMGIGAENKYQETVAKGKWGDRPYLFASKLAASDVTSASCAKSGSNYVITLKLKNGSSSADKNNPASAPTAALDKCGICVGSEDKGYFDHKTASVIYDAIAGTYESAVVKEQYSNAVVKATVNASTGNLVSLVVEWNQSAELSKLLGMSATASGISHVTYSSFKY